MPGKKVNQNARKAKRNRRSVASMPTQITQARTVVFPYAANAVLGEAAAGAGFAWTFRVNSLFDPDFTGAGSQPVGYDQFSALYGRYDVHSVRFEIQYANLTSLPARIGYYLTPQSTLPAAPSIWCVQPYGRAAVVGPVGSGKDVVSLRGSSTLFKELGVTKRQFIDEADFSATTSTSPARVLYLHLYTTSLAAAGAANVAFALRIWYTSELSQLVNLTYS